MTTSPTNFSNSPALVTPPRKNAKSAKAPRVNHRNEESQSEYVLRHNAWNGDRIQVFTFTPPTICFCSGYSTWRTLLDVWQCGHGRGRTGKRGWLGFELLVMHSLILGVVKDSGGWQENFHSNPYPLEGKYIDEVDRQKYASSP